MTVKEPSRSFGIEINGGKYTVEPRGSGQADVIDANGAILMRADERLFVDAGGTELFRLDGQRYVNVTGGDYALVDVETDEPIVVLSEEFSFAKSTWKIVDGESEETLATASARSTVMGLFRNKGGLFRRIFPCQYRIETADGDHVGTITKGWLGSKYIVNIRDEAPVKPALLLCAMAVHNLETTK